MNQPPSARFTDREFHDQLHELIAHHPARVSLLHSDGHHLHEIFSIGTGDGKAFRIFDHVGGFYLVGEGVTPDLLAAIHSLFTRYCRAHEAILEAERENPIHVQFRSFAQHDRNRLCMHFQANVGKFHPPLE